MLLSSHMNTGDAERQLSSLCMKICISQLRFLQIRRQAPNSESFMSSAWRLFTRAAPGSIIGCMHSFVRALGMDGLQQDTSSMNLATLMDAYRRPLARQMCL